MPEQAGIDSRQRGFFWGPNEWIRQWAPLIGLDGVGLLNSYDVWCDRRQESDTEGFAFPDREDEMRFYGIVKGNLAVITYILEATGWIRVEVKWRATGHGRGGGGVTCSRKNYYEIIHRDWNLTLEDVRAVLKLAEKNERIFRRIYHIFRPDFAPIDEKDNPWITILPRLRDDPLWQKLAAKALKRAKSYSSRRHKDSDNGQANQESLIVTIGCESPNNQESLIVTTGKPAEPTVTISDRKHVVGDVGVYEEYIIKHFASLAGHADYEPSQRDQSTLNTLYAEGYSNDEIIAGVERAVATALARDVTPRFFTYCTAAVRDFPPTCSPSTTTQTEPEEPGSAMKQVAVPVAAKLLVAPLGLLAAMPESLHTPYYEIAQLCQQRGLDMPDEEMLDLARLTIDFDDAAKRQKDSGLQWVLEALRQIDSHVDKTSRYVRGILTRWQKEAEKSEMQQVSIIAAMPVEPKSQVPVDPNVELWKQALSQLELQMTKATFDTWLRNTSLLELRREEGAPVWIVRVTNQYAKDWLEHRLLRTIESTLARLSSEPAQIQFVVQ